MSRAVLAALAAVVVTAALVAVALVVGLGDDGGDPPAATPSSPTSAPPVELADVDTTTLAVARAAFCDRVAPEGITRALGAEPVEAAAYDDGERTEVAGAFDDVAHEFGCAWTGGGTAARAWVFAPPVTVAATEALLRAARRTEGCTPRPEAPAYGDPTAALVCRVARGRTEASFRGLFGDAWLTCTLTGRLSPAAALARAEDWCVSVLAAARG